VVPRRVAAGALPVAQGNDGGGRCESRVVQPVSRAGDSSVVVHRIGGFACSHGPIARTVADAAALLEILAGPVAELTWRRAAARSVRCRPEPGGYLPKGRLLRAAGT
jgi:Asp-tRNA(Asn)/Glu-tRNA(Gln) amidotransferase A subunit family amidase